MRRVHPLWRGFWLAWVLTAAAVLLTGTDWQAAYHFDRRALALCCGTAAGAFLAALPARLHRRGIKRPGLPRWQRCLTAFLCGAAMVLAASLAGSTRILPALFEGSLGAFAFVGTAWLTGFITTRIAGRRARA